jgi:diguanylate cyclase
LAEIDQYVRQSQQDRIDTVNESSRLKDSVDTNVVAIQESVTAAYDITQLKDDVQGHLSEIRKRVEEHQLAETEREEISKQGYAHIISELSRTQKETLMLKEQLQESQQKMLRDPLTGLPNRLAYEERIALEVNRSRRNNMPFCLAMWDIDHFKNVNDTYGHDAGDRVLKLLAKIIITRVRKVDMFARIGGEEFVLLMPDTVIDDALNLNNQLRTSLEDSGFHYKGSPCPITSSVGIAVFEEYDTPEQILHKADKALYQSKREGRNRCTIYKHDGYI